MKDKINSHNTSDNWHSVYADITNLVGEDNTLKYTDTLEEWI